jgi:hypothetical protein
VILANSTSANFFFWLALSLILLVASRWWLTRRIIADFALSDDDAVVHLSLVSELRQNPFTPPNFSRRFLFSGTGYPWGFHFFFALTKIPLRFLERFGTVVATIFDSLTLLLVALSLQYFGGELHWMLLFPCLRLFWGKPGRAHSFSERPFATFFGNLYLLTVFLVMEVDDSLWLFAISIFAGSVVMVSSKFALQAIVFFSLGFSIFFASAEPIIILMLSLVSAAIITGGEAFKIIGSSVRWSVFYRQFLQKRTSKTKRNFYRELIRGPKSSWVASAQSNPLVGVFLDNPLLPLVLLSPFFGDYPTAWHAWLLIGFALVMAISTPLLTFLGEPGRYLEFSIIHIFVILSNSSPHLDVVYGTSLVLAGLATFWILVREAQKTPGLASVERVASMRELRNWVRGLDDAVVLGNPGRLNLFLGYCNPNISFLWIHSAISAGDRRSAFERLVPKNYPKATIEIGWFVENFDLRYLVLEKGEFSDQDLAHREPHISYSKCFENDNFVVFALGHR